MLVGVADGETPAAAMYDSVSGFAFGPIFEGDDAAGQVEAFLEWLGREPYVLRAEEIGLTSVMLPAPGRTASDPRVWPDPGLELLVAAWRKDRDNPTNGGTENG